MSRLILFAAFLNFVFGIANVAIGDATSLVIGCSNFSISGFLFGLWVGDRSEQEAA